MSDLTRFFDSDKLPQIPDGGLRIGDFEITEPFGRRGEIWFGEYRFCIRKDGIRILDLATMENYLLGGAIVWDPNPLFNKDYFVTEIAKAERKVYQRYKNDPRNLNRKFRPREWLINEEIKTDDDEDHDIYNEEKILIEDNPDCLATISCSPSFWSFTRLMAWNEYADISLLSDKGPWAPQNKYSEIAFYAKYEPQGSRYINLNDIIAELFFRTSKFSKDDLLLPQ